MHTAKVQEIIAAAMEATQAGKAHVFVNYSAHTNCLNVFAHPVDTDYRNKECNARIWLIVSTYIYLEFDTNGVRDELDAILEEIKGL